MSEKIIEAIKSKFKGLRVQEAEPIFEGEDSYIINDRSYVTVFKSASEMIEFYKNAFKNPEDFQATVTIANRFSGPGTWSKFVDNKKLTEYIMSAVGDKKIDLQLKYLIERHPVEALKRIFDTKTVEGSNSVLKVAVRFFDDDKLNPLIVSMIKELRTVVLNFPGTKETVKMFIWPDFGRNK